MRGEILKLRLYDFSQIHKSKSDMRREFKVTLWKAKGRDITINSNGLVSYFTACVNFSECLRQTDQKCLGRFVTDEREAKADLKPMTGYP